MPDCSLFINPEIKSFWVENPIWNLDKYKYSQIDIIQTSKGEIYFTQNCRSCKYSSWWMSQILSSLRSFTISLLWQFRKRHNVCGQRILMFKYFETQYWNFPGSWSWDRCKLEVMSDGDSEDVATDPLTIYIQDTLRFGSQQSVSPVSEHTADSGDFNGKCCTRQGDRPWMVAMMCAAAAVTRTCVWCCAMLRCYDAHLDPLNYWARATSWPLQPQCEHLELTFHCRLIWTKC